MMKRAIAIGTMVLAGFAAHAAETAQPEAKAESKPAKTNVPANKPVQNPAGNNQLGMSVTGTQEAPKVLYIVPWKTLDAVPAEPYVSGLLDEVFSPVDPVVFERSVHQHEQIQTGATPAAVEK